MVVSVIVGIKMIFRQVPIDSKKIGRSVLRRLETGDGLKFW